MNLDEMKQQWSDRHSQADEAEFKDLAHAVVTKGERFENMIRRRDRIETVAGIFVVAVFAIFLFRANWPPAISWSIGLLIATSTFGVATILWTRRRDAMPHAGLSMREYATAELVRINRQIALLESSAWWYAGPVMLSCCIFFWAAMSSVPLPAHIYYGFLSAFFLCFFAAGYIVYRINRDGAQRDLVPLREEFEGLIEAIRTSENDGDAAQE